MWFNVDPASGIPIYLQIVYQVKRATATGLLREGDQMPSVRELAVELTVNPNTIAKAYQELERAGLIRTVRGVGTFVAGKEVKIIREERIKILLSAIDRVLVDAHHLGFSREEVKGFFERRLNEWKVNNE